MTSEQARAKWEHAITRYSECMADENAAKLNYDSIFAMVLRRVRETEPVTIAEKLAKGEPEVIEAGKAYMEAERKVLAGKEYLRFIEATVNDLRANMRNEANITR
jgi:hypothetical protein